MLGLNETRIHPMMTPNDRQRFKIFQLEISLSSSYKNDNSITVVLSIFQEILDKLTHNVADYKITQIHNDIWIEKQSCIQVEHCPS